MNRYKFSDLLSYEEKIKQIYSYFKINYHDLNRIKQYFAYLNEIEVTRNISQVKLNEVIQRDKAKYYYSQFYVLEICNIFEALDKSKQDQNIIKIKLIDLIKGTYLLSEENIENTKARNTTFELSLFSFFHFKGLRVALGNPNPDVIISTGNLTYDIECKRPASFETLEKNIKKAMKQLRKAENKNNVPTIALSLEKIIFNKEYILNSFDEKSALQSIDSLLLKFSKQNKNMLDKICGTESYLVLYYLSCLTGFKNGILPMANATYIVGNIYNFKPELSHRIVEDLKKLTSQEIIKL